MRLSLRFLVPLLIALAAFAYAAVPFVDGMMQRWFVRDLDERSALIAYTVEEPLRQLLSDATPTRITAFFNRLTQDQQLYAVAYCPPGEAKPIASERFPAEIGCHTVDANPRSSKPASANYGSLHLTAAALGPDVDSGDLVVVNDTSFIATRRAETRRYLFYFFIALGAMVALITVVIGQLSWRGWVQGLRALLRGEGLWRPATVEASPELQPFARDVRELVRELERQYRPHNGNGDGRIWTQEALRTALRSELRGNDVIAVSNREPYIHIKTDQGIRVQRPASGLVTALEPVMRACSGVWIAHGSGSADRDTVDRNDRVGVPPDHPNYQVRRIWLTPEEEAGYYGGFSNEGLWPLCHIAHVRPTFRTSDWNHYGKVNAKFAAAVAAESKTPDPIVLVQDYHFALLPQMIRDRLPQATIITFWHIPWPNPEAFAICPWRNELLQGLLGSSILGFHTQFHCNNFLDTVDRLLEARVDRETFTVTRAGHTTAVRRYPISIEWPPAALAHVPTVERARRTVRERLGLPLDHKLGIGIDRLDYTKGVIERFQAIARLLEREPRWIGKMSFVQIAAPTRGTIDEYRDYYDRVTQLAQQINAGYPDVRYPPIILIAEHHEPESVFEYHRAADFCFVSSLHDGMNLVAKEFVAARDDEQGVLILSRFAGASRELPEALVVNPYDADQCASALHVALTMPADEQRDRMRLMRSIVREFNVYRWAGRMLFDAAALRQRDRFRVDLTVPGRV